jgi:glycosyltransferase involved in cell wall biosynthesis
LERLKQRLRLEQKRVLLFSGRLYAEKRVDFLLRAFVLLQQRDPHVALLILGEGTERGRLEQLATQLELRNVHFLGEVVEPRDSAAYFSLADVLVLPSLVGLAIVHGFAYGLPLVTTDFPGHGPELDYLSDQTGMMTKADPAAYAEAISRLFASPERLNAMKRAAMRQGDTLRLSHSVGRFLDGIDLLSNGRSRAA